MARNTDNYQQIEKHIEKYRQLETYSLISPLPRR